MRCRMIVVLCLLCMALLLFTACGVAFVAPDVQGRPQSTTDRGDLGYEPPVPQSTVTVATDVTEKQLPAYWKGQSYSLPGVEMPSQSTPGGAEPSVSGSGSASGNEPQGSTTSSEGGVPSQSIAATTTEPPHTTATTPDPQGEGRGDAFEITESEKGGNGTKEIQCTPFY